MEFSEITFQCVHGSFYSSLIKVHLYTSSVHLFFPQRWNREYHRVSTYPGKSDNNEICSIIPFVGVIILCPKSISWDLEFTNNFYKNFQLRYIHVGSDSCIYGQVLCQICKDPEVLLSNLQVIPKAQLWGWGNLDICIKYCLQAFWHQTTLLAL